MTLYIFTSITKPQTFEGLFCRVNSQLVGVIKQFGTTFYSILTDLRNISNDFMFKKVKMTKYVQMTT